MLPLYPAQLGILSQHGVYFSDIAWSSSSPHACGADPPHTLTRVLTLALTGEEPHTGIVAGVVSGHPALVTCVEDERLEFQVCEQIELSGV